MSRLSFHLSSNFISELISPSFHFPQGTQILHTCVMLIISSVSHILLLLCSSPLLAKHVLSDTKQQEKNVPSQCFKAETFLNHTCKISWDCSITTKIGTLQTKHKPIFLQRRATFRTVAIKCVTAL